MLVGALTVAALATVVVVVFNIGEKRAASGPPRVESLAVLPLENLSGDPDQEYLADGITDALITELGKIRSVRVISRTSILSYKGARKSLPEIGRELGVDAVVEGSVVRSGNRIRITAQLLDAASDRHLWAQAFERDVHDVVALYADVAEAIGSEIHANIDRAATAVVRARPVDPEAWASYVRGRYLWERQGADNLKKARDYFRQAIDRQPDYALAYAGLADAYLLLAQNRVLTPTDAVPKAKEAALKALELDPSLAEGYTSLAGIACTFEADWSGAERAYRRAFEINPNYAIAHQWWGSTLAGLGRHAEAAVEMRKALEIDPVSLRVGQSAGRALYLARRYTEAVERYKKTLELNPNFVPALTGLGRVYIALGRKEQALAELERAATISDRAPSSLGSLGLAYGLFGDRNHALKILDELKDLSAHAYVSPLDYADVYLGLRDHDQVFRELHRAAEHQLSSLGSLKTSVEYDPLRTDPRFADLLRLVNLN
jgi:TolB-like protein/Tfp pilus assembly protein PilF